MQNNKICRLRARVLKAEHAFNEAIIEAFPVGSRAVSFKGRGQVTVEILDHTFDRVRVKNPMSGKVYHVDYYHLHACHACKTHKCYKDAEKGRG